MQVIKLKKETFHLLFPTMEYNAEKRIFHSVSITVSANDNIFKIKDGTDKNQVPFISTGTGIAGYDGEYPYLMLSDTGNHYIMYSKEDNDNRRARLIFDFKDIYEVSWTIKKIWINMRIKTIRKNNSSFNIERDKKEEYYEYKNAKHSIKDLPLDRIHLIAISDFNLNGIIEKNEYIRFTIEFSD